VDRERLTGIRRRERLVGDQPAVERQVRHQPAHLEFAQRAAGTLQGLGTRGPGHDELGQQRAERRGDDRTWADGGIEPYART